MTNKNRKTKSKSGFSLKNLGVADWCVIAVFAVLILVPDPIDLATFGLPIIEALSALVFLVITTKNSLRNKT